jgi:nitrogen fixation protein FixH
MTREFTGWHMLALICGGFSIIIAVNLTLAYQAIATFPGLEVANSYVASQTFDRDRAAQDALGWDVTAQLTASRLTLAIKDRDDRPVHPRVVSATLGRATSVAQDSTPEFVWDGVALGAPVAVGAGYWNLRLVLEAADGTLFQRRIELHVTQTE